MKHKVQQLDEGLYSWSFNTIRKFLIPQDIDKIWLLFVSIQSRKQFREKVNRVWSSAPSGNHRQLISML